ncbi:MAG: PAS domain S-box protein [Caldilineaceae bacterium]
MRSAPLRSRLALLLTCLLAIVLFLLDTAVPQAHFWGSYLLPIVAIFLWGRRRDIYAVTALASVLVLATYWLDAVPTLKDLVLNHLLPLVVLWGAAWLLAQRREMQEQQARSGRNLEEQVKARTARADRLAAIVEASHEAIISANLDGTVVFMNRSAEELYGVSAATAVGRNIVNLALPQNLAGFGEMLGRVQKGEAVAADDASWQLPDGTTRIISVVVSPIHTGDGQVTSFAAFARDVTGRKQLEDAVRNSELKWRSVFEFLPVGVSVVNSKDQVTDTNAALPQILAMTPEGILQGAYAHRRYFHPDLTPMPPEEFPSLRALREGQVVRDIVIGVEKEDGELIWVNVSATPESLDGYAVTVTVDITERKQLEDALAAAMARLRAVIENTADRVWSVDGSYCFLVGNSVFAHSMEQQIGRPLALGECVVGDPFPSPLRAFWRALYDRALAGESFMVEIPSSLRPGGTLACYMNPIYAADGSVAGVSGRTTDITDIKRYQQLLQDANVELEQRVAARTAELQAALAELQRAGKLKDEFLAMISHELRTPLTGVLSMSEMLEDRIAGPLNDRQATYVKGIVESGERLLTVINGILGYTHLISGKIQPEAAPCELAHLLAICAASQQYKAAAKHQTIAVQVAPPDLTITADATALAEVLKRLLDNAVKFTPDGGQIGLEAHPTPAPDPDRDPERRRPRRLRRNRLHSLPDSTGDFVDLVVWDTGIGIAPDQLDHVFRPFTQADARLSRSHEGIGLGLAYVDQMVRLMGGTIRLESALGEGSRFTVTLPA